MFERQVKIRSDRIDSGTLTIRKNIDCGVKIKERKSLEENKDKINIDKK